MHNMHTCDICWNKIDKTKEEINITKKNDSITIYCQSCWDDLDPWFD